jgi:hypothetical protein
MRAPPRGRVRAVRAHRSPLRGPSRNSRVHRGPAADALASSQSFWLVWLPFRPVRGVGGICRFEHERDSGLSQRVRSTAALVPTHSLDIVRFVRCRRSDGDANFIEGPFPRAPPSEAADCEPVMTTPPPPPATCPILHLDLGPLDLDLLGLHVHLNEVVLDVTAIPGPGNLLGNLLCAIAGLLDSVDLGGVLGGLLQNLIDALIRLLQGLGGGPAGARPAVQPS